MQNFFNCLILQGELNQTIKAHGKFVRHMGEGAVYLSPTCNMSPQIKQEHTAAELFTICLFFIF